MHKRLPVIGSIGLILCLLIALSLGSSPTVEGKYTQIRISPSVFSASWLGGNTDLLEVRFADNDGSIYIFYNTGETILNVPEGNTISAVGAYATIDDNYAGTVDIADSRTQITVVIRDADNAIQYDNVLGTGFPTTTVDNGTYYTVYAFELGLSILLTSGTWDMDIEYEIFAIPP